MRKGQARADEAPAHRKLRAAKVPVLSSCALLASGCGGPQSALDAAGAEADTVLTLFWVMTAGSALIWLFVIGLSVYVTKAHSGAYSEKAGLRLIIWGGCVFPTVVLAALLVYGLMLIPDLRREANGPTIAVSGERFWWRVSYDAEGEPGVARRLPEGGVPSANEVWLPLGKRTEILLGSPDVIHSFWIPSIAGKTDAIPGRVTRLVVEPTREGVYHGACAEFCGEAHAQMNLRVVVVDEEAYLRHVAEMAEPAVLLDHPGRVLFLANGCGACHRVRGTEADGLVGPDLTHVAARRTIGAGLLPTTEENIAAFIKATDHLKPGVEMPSFAMLPDDEIAIIADWLGSLE